MLPNGSQNYYYGGGASGESNQSGAPFTSSMSTNINKVCCTCQCHTQGLLTWGLQSCYY